LIMEPFAPGRAARESQRRIELVRAIIDPTAQRVAAGLLERGLLQRAVFQDNDVPAEIFEELLVACPQALTHDRIEALAVVVDDPPTVAQALFPAFQQGFEDIS